MSVSGNQESFTVSTCKNRPGLQRQPVESAMHGDTAARDLFKEELLNVVRRATDEKLSRDSPSSLRGERDHIIEITEQFLDKSLEEPYSDFYPLYSKFMVSPKTGIEYVELVVFDSMVQTRINRFVAG